VNNIVDARDKVIFPGLINTHAHSFQTLLKGLGADTSLDAWLAHVITPSVTRLDAEDLYAGAMLSALDAVSTGTTTILDYQYAQKKEGLNEAAIQGYRDVGMRLVLGRGFADTGVLFGANPEELEPLEKIQHDVQRLVVDYHGKQDGLVRVALAPSALWMCSPDCLRWVSQYAREKHLLVTAHTAETSYDDACSRKLHGTDDFGTLSQYNLLGEHMLMVHAVQLSEEQVKMAADTSTRFSYNPVSNMYLASGAAPIPWMKHYGVVGSLGTDGAASNNGNDMLEVLKSAILLAKVAHLDPKAMTALDALSYATCDGAKALGMDDEIGSIEVGKRADMFLFHPGKTAKASACHDPVMGLAYASDARNIEMVMVQGEVILKDYQACRVNEGRMISMATQRAKTLAKKIGEHV